jgi:hypothetical protein
VGEFLVIRAEISTAADMLEIFPDLKEYYWEESPNYLDVLARWLPKKEFKILPKFFDINYKPGTVGDEADKLITEIEGCYIAEDQIPIWRSTILELPRMKQELKRILEEDILDMDFAKELATYMEDIFEEPYRRLDERELKSINENLKDFAKILTKLAECIDKIKIKKGVPLVDFEFCIPRS